MSTDSTPRPGRVAVASFDDYVSAQAAVDHLSDEGFPVEHVTIVGEGLRLVEQVTGRRGFGRAALEGAVNGALLGLFLGFLFGLFSIVDPLVSGLWLGFWGLVIGALIGALLGLAAHAATGGRRDFSSISGTQATRYDVLVQTAHADEAERILAAGRGASSQRRLE